MIADFIAAWINTRPTPETGEDIDARAAVVAHAVQHVEPGQHWPYGAAAWRALVLRTWFEEGARFSLEVHAGRTRGDEGRAACLGQVWSHGVILPRAEWLQTMGVDETSTAACAHATARYLTVGVERCMRPSLSELENTARVVMLYGTGKRCTPSAWAYERASGALRWRTIFEPSEAING